MLQLSVKTTEVFCGLLHIKEQSFNSSVVQEHPVTSLCILIKKYLFNKGLQILQLNL